MNKTSVLVAFALVCAFSFSFDESDYAQCGTVESDCMQQCCESAGGTFTFTEDYGECLGGGPSAAATSETMYMDCTLANCRSGLISCVAPSSSCSGDYTSCMGSCRAGGTDPETCDYSCFDAATICVADYMEGLEGAPYAAPSDPYTPPSSNVPPPTNSSGGCCGGFALAFGLLGVFLWRNQ